MVLDAAAVLYSDGGIDLGISTEGAIEMNDAPAGVPTATTVVTSFWQFDLVGFRVERMLWWIAAPNAVQLLTVAP